MAHTEQHYRDAAQGLKGELGSTFGKSSLNDAAVSNIHRIANFKDNAELMGLKGGSVSGIQKRGESLARTVNASQSAQDEKAKKSFDNVLFLGLLDQAETYAAQLAADVAKIEASYEAQYGDAWVEQIALEVLGPDEIPERNEGEDIISYRARVKETLLEQMIDPATGQVKPEHSDSPHTQWAERSWKHEKVDAQMDIATDESRPQAEREAAVQAVIDTGRHDDAAYAITSFDARDKEYEMLGDAMGEIRTEATDADTGVELDSFFAP